MERNSPPVHTTVVSLGVIPTNQQSELFCVVPVLPAMGNDSLNCCPRRRAPVPLSTTPFIICIIIHAMRGLMASRRCGVKVSRTLPLLSSILVMKIGCTYSPWLANVDIAPVISETVISAAPTLMAGTASIGLVTPILRAMLITIFGPLAPPAFMR